jgi:hypothetical protein
MALSNRAFPKLNRFTPNPASSLPFVNPGKDDTLRGAPTFKVISFISSWFVNPGMNIPLAHSPHTLLPALPFPGKDVLFKNKYLFWH